MAINNDEIHVPKDDVAYSIPTGEEFCLEDAMEVWIPKYPKGQKMGVWFRPVLFTAASTGGIEPHLFAIMMKLLMDAAEKPENYAAFEKIAMMTITVCQDPKTRLAYMQDMRALVEDARAMYSKSADAAENQALRDAYDRMCDQYDREIELVRQHVDDMKSEE